MPARLACAWFAALALFALGTRDAWPPDETRYADVARAMRAGEGLVVPRLHGETYGEKPPLFFWATALIAAAGVPLGAAPRAVSALAALGTLALVPGLARRLGRNRRESGRAGWMLATSPLFLACGLVGLLDATSAALVTAAVAAKVARRDAARGSRFALLIAEGVAIGFALLTKGPVLLLFPLGLRLGARLGREGRGHRAAFDRSDLVSFALAFALAAAWLLAAASVAGDDYVRSITLGQLVRRVSGDAPHLRLPGFLLVATLVGFLPWILAARVPKRPFERPSADTGALLGWWLLPLLLLSTLRTQQPQYALPGIPAAAILFAPLLTNVGPGTRRAIGAVATLLGVALVAAAGLAPRLLAAMGPGDVVAVSLASDPLLRAAAALAGLVLPGIVWFPRRRFAPGSVDPTARDLGLPFARTAVALAVLAGAAVVALGRIDPWISGRAIAMQPAVREAPRLVAPGSLRSAIRVSSGRIDVGELAEDGLADRLRADPGLVALVWVRDLPRLGLAPGDVELLSRGVARGRELVALRATPNSVGEESTNAARAPAEPITRPRVSP